MKTLRPSINKVEYITEPLVVNETKRISQYAPYISTSKRTIVVENPSSF